jgi:hypothetical protein
MCRKSAKEPEIIVPCPFWGPSLRKADVMIRAQRALQAQMLIPKVEKIPSDWLTPELFTWRKK